MATINELIGRIDDPELQRQITQEVEKLQKVRKFGLVFEDHVPECTPLFDIPVRKGSTVAKKTDKQMDKLYVVTSIKNGKAYCKKKEGDDAIVAFPVDDLIVTAKFGEPIFPFLQLLDTVCNAPNSDLWHTLIQADNYHALQLLQYLYAGQVDCIYIDPPYNTGAHDWKYNNDYVDGTDSYRHSKWLSMMEKRLTLAKKLLNPKDSVLIVTIDEKEYLHLGCLLEQIFPEAKIQMVSSATNAKGVARDEFYRVNEYLFFVRFGECCPKSLPLTKEWRGNIKTSTTQKVRWGSLMRSGTNAEREHSPGCFYPIFISLDKKKICGAGQPLPKNMKIEDNPTPNGVIALYPIHYGGVEGCWQYSRERFLEIQNKGYVRISTQTKNGITLRYISEGWQKKVENGTIPIIGKAEDGSLLFDDDDYTQEYVPCNQWWIPKHDATEFGSKFLNNFIGKRFSFPKSLYAVRDAIQFFVSNKPNALILDFFAGSGTTLHAVNLLNAEDDGHRRCIMVTNNEVSEEEALNMAKQGLKPGDTEWEKWGIAQYVTWPRTVCSIEGHDVNGRPIVGEYITSNTETKTSERHFVQINYMTAKATLKQKKDLVTLINKQTTTKLPKMKEDVPFLVAEEREYNASILFDTDAVNDWMDALEGNNHITELYIVTQHDTDYRKIKADVSELMGTIEESVPVKMLMSDGFAANAVFFKLGFLNQTNVKVGREFAKMLPTLWMKAGSHGPCPDLNNEIEPDMLVLPTNKMAILCHEDCIEEFVQQVNTSPHIETAFIVTNSEQSYKQMVRRIHVEHTFQLYRDYLDNFRINQQR